MAVVTTNLGAVTAYADAVAGGYTGTKAEWQALMASYGSVAEQAAESASQAADSASAASTKASEATTAAASANTAKNDAETAKNAAETAQGKAETAQGAAEDSAESISASAAQIAQNASDITDLKSGFKKLVVLNPYWSDGYLAESGRISKDNTYTSMTSEGLPVAEGMVINWAISYSTARNAWLAYCLYNSVGSLIGSRVVLVNGSTISQSGTITVPSEARYIRLSIRVWDGIYPLLSASFRGVVNNYLQTLESIPNNILDNQYRRWNESVYITGTGGTWVSDSRIEYTTDYIPVTDGDVFFHFAVTKDAPWMAIAFYDSNYAFLANSRNITLDATIISDGLQYAYQKITVPNGVSYLRACTRTDGLGRFCLLRQGDNWITDEYIMKKIASFIVDYGTDYQIAVNGTVKGINHRGYNPIAPENTIPAFKMSRERGFAYVETDVEFTSDGVPVLLHDATINRTARNADGSELTETINISDITYAEALTYDFGIWKSEAYAGTKIPTFEEFILLCRNIGLSPVVELKSDPFPTEMQIQELVAIVEKHAMLSKTIWQSFSPTALEYVVRYNATASVTVISSAASDDAITYATDLKTGKNKVGVNIYYPNITDSFVQSCINADIELNVYTPNSATTIINLNPYVNGVSSDSVNAPVVIYSNSK